MIMSYKNSQNIIDNNVDYSPKLLTFSLSFTFSLFKCMHSIRKDEIRQLGKAAGFWMWLRGLMEAAEPPAWKYLDESSWKQQIKQPPSSHTGWKVMILPCHPLTPRATASLWGVFSQTESLCLSCALGR